MADNWIVENLRCGPLTDADRERIVDDLRLCHRASGLDWPDNVRWVRSPDELAAAVAAAPRMIRRWRRTHRDRWPVVRWWARWFGYRVLALLAAFVAFFVFARVCQYLSRDQEFVGYSALVFGLALLAMLLGCYSVLYWAVVTTIREIISRREEQRRTIQPEEMTARARLLAPGPTPGPAEDLDPEGVKRVRQALTPVWNKLWLGGNPPNQVKEWRNLREVRVGAAAAMPARPMLGWIAYRGLTIVCEPPLELHTEPMPGGAFRLHNATGPAVRWPDPAGSRDYYVHGVRMPERLFGDDVRIHDLHREPNSEVRRVVIERMGWPAYLERARLRRVADVADPGNAGHRLRLYDLPKGMHETKRLLIMVNGSPDRSGRPREYAELVPGWFDDPVAAAAWQYGCPVDDYRKLARRT